MLKTKNVPVKYEIPKAAVVWEILIKLSKKWCADNWRHKMKKILLVAGILLLISTASQAEIKSVSLQVDGLSCPICALSIEKKLKSVPTVATVDVHLKQAKTDLTFKPESQLDLSAIQTAVKEAGFTLKDVEITVSGTVKQEKDGNFIIESQGDKTQLFLFDQNHTDVDTYTANLQMLDKKNETQLLKAQQENTLIKINGVIHQHADMPFGLLIKKLETNL